MFSVEKGLKIFYTTEGILKNMIWPKDDEYIGTKINFIGDLIVSFHSKTAEEITTIRLPICALAVHYKVNNFAEFVNYLRQKISHAKPGQMNDSIREEEKQ